MKLSFIATSLLYVSILTNVTVEALKKLLKNKSYKPDVMAAVISIVMAVIFCVFNIIMNDILITAKVILEILVTSYFSFLISTLGYDKVISIFKEMKGGVDIEQ